MVASTHGDGDSEGKPQSAKAEAEVTLSAEQADVVITHSSRMNALEQAKDILGSIGGVMGASLTSLVTRLQHIERKQFRPRLETDAAVANALKASLVAEQALYHRQRVEFQEQAQKKKDLKRISDEFEQMKEKIRKAQKEHKAAEAVVTASEFKKTFPLAALGQGKKNGGGKETCQKARFQVMERIRAAAELSPEQVNDWEFFKTTWDREMADAQQEKWGELFAELMQHILNELAAGKKEALSKFMHAETQRVLGDVPALSVPGITRQ